VDGKEIGLDSSNEKNIISLLMQIDPEENDQTYGLLHAIFNPKENRFYRQIGINAYTEKGDFINIREDPLQILPENSRIYILTKGPCISDFDQILPYNEFFKLIKDFS
jgi:hypothetical protein